MDPVRKRVIKPVKRPVEGVLCIEKPYQWSSNQALQQVKRWFNAEKAGHTGALDPLATGLLPICFGEATKFSTYWLSAEKRYQVGIELGATSTTGDLEGTITSTSACCCVLPKEEVEGALKGLLGEQQQLVSPYSALKYRGLPSYYYARKSIEIPKKQRIITVKECRCLSYTYPSLEVEIACSKGTYIRSLVEELGSRLGCGAYVKSLRRIGIAGWSQGTIAWEALETLGIRALAAQQYTELDRLLAPMSCLVAHLPELRLTDKALVKKLFCGQTIALSHRTCSFLLDDWSTIAFGPSHPVALFAEHFQPQLIGIGYLLESEEKGLWWLKPQRLVRPHLV